VSSRELEETKYKSASDGDGELLKTKRTEGMGETETEKSGDWV